MSNFKYRNVKNIIVSKKNSTTIDYKHKEICDQFNYEMTEILPKLEEEKKELKLILQEQQIKKTITIDAILDMNDRLKSIKNEKNKIKEKKNEYMLNNSKYIFDYFEKKKKISEENSKTTILYNFFKKENDELLDSMTNERTNVQKYLSNVDDTFIDINSFIMQTEICTFCNKGQFIPIECEGVIVCNACSKSIPYLVENEKSSYKDPPKEVCFYAYKRINHFREILAQFQAKETTQIPDEVFENIKQQIKKERVKLEQITDKRAKDILKQLGYNKYYEHIPYIKDKLGIKPPIMSSDLENTLCNLFMDIQVPYARYCPDDRVNFLNYYYTIYKLCELLDQRQFLPFFPMLKDREKRIEQDEIWKNICYDLDWEYIPTI
jgi:hypothetical protein